MKSKQPIVLVTIGAVIFVTLVGERHRYEIEPRQNEKAAQMTYESGYSTASGTSHRGVILEDFDMLPLNSRTQTRLADYSTAPKRKYKVFRV